MDASEWDPARALVPTTCISAVGSNCVPLKKPCVPPSVMVLMGVDVPERLVGWSGGEECGGASDGKEQDPAGGKYCCCCCCCCDLGEASGDPLAEHTCLCARSELLFCCCCCCDSGSVGGVVVAAAAVPGDTNDGTVSGCSNVLCAASDVP